LERVSSQRHPGATLDHEEITGSNTMPNVFIEARPKGRPEPSPIEVYVVEDHADSVLKTFKPSTRRSSGRGSKVIILSSLVSCI
jgi:hypothetical protein